MRRLLFSAAVLAIFSAGYFVGLYHGAPETQHAARPTLADARYTWSYMDERDGWAVWLACETEDEAKGYAEHLGGGIGKTKTP